MPNAPKRYGQQNPTPRRPDRRESAAKRGYGHKWRLAREGFLRKHPLCVRCLELGRTRAATDVDHIIPHKGDMKLFWKRDNWQALCGTCHKAKTGKGQ